MKPVRSILARVGGGRGAARRVLVLGVLLAATSGVLGGAPRLGSQVFFNGTLDLASDFGSEHSNEVQQLIRGDGPFDPLRLRLFGDVVVTRRITVFNQFLIAPSASFGFKSFRRSYVQVNVFEKENADLSIQVGKIPTVFGNLGPRAYSDRNPLISTPLMYHYPAFTIWGAKTASFNLCNSL